MSTKEAFLDGMRRGYAMYLNPEKAYAEELERLMDEPDVTVEAWQSVGQSLRMAMDRETRLQRWLLGAGL